MDVTGQVIIYGLQCFSLEFELFPAAMTAEPPMPMPTPAPTPAPALFIADEVALDFINTAYGVEPNHVDVLGSDRQVLEWLQRAGLKPEFDSPPPATRQGSLLQSALALRECARDLVERRKAGAGADVSVLNRLLALGETHQQLVWKKGHVPTISVHRNGSRPDAVLVPLAEAIARLLAEGDFELVRRCESADCTLWFYDRTKSHHRRWCSMAMCGNRAKVAAFRERRRNG
jgi:predicted RNA-binding Zn ribbon-like protein